MFNQQIFFLSSQAHFLAISENLEQVWLFIYDQKSLLIFPYIAGLSWLKSMKWNDKKIASIFFVPPPPPNKKNWVGGNFGQK